ncbi:MAG: DNA polymerase III subunit alpha [candidate division Zixibacteria bacterium]|nr:DNA polymerase III subunit alpha [candidate division Zixibacteria bacterium]
MKFSNFVHLHNHTQYSLLDGASKVKDLIATVKNMKMPAIAITDHGNMFGAIDFYKTATAAGVKPIIGMEAYVAGTSRFDHKKVPGYPDGGFHMVLLAKNQQGYKSLMKLGSAAYREGFYHRPRIDREILTEYHSGLIALSACLKGEVPYWLARGEEDKAEEAAQFYGDLFGVDHFYIEIQDHGIDKEDIVRPKLVELAQKLDLPLVATNDCHYIKQEDAEAHDALICIQTGKLVSDTNRMKYNTDQIYVKSAEEMGELFAEYPQAIENTIKIAERCNLEIELGTLLLPEFPIPVEDKTPDEYLEDLCREGIAKLYPEVTDEVTERMMYELGVIKQLGWAGYFLITMDFVQYAKDHDIPVGPGRGSAAGSIVSYSLGITNVDPIKYELLFERFLNPERISMPDIDIDFGDRQRDKIIEYVQNKYHKDNVTQIITFGTMAARGVVRDVGRVLAVPYSEVDKIAKMIPAAPDMTLEKALTQSPDLKQLVDSDPRVAKLIQLSKTLEGLCRHASTHAAGVVIAPADLTDYVPLFKGSKGEVTTQYPMKHVEMIGLLKMDFLGLRTLTVIDDAVKMVKVNHDVDIDLDNIDLAEEPIYKMFGCGHTIGIFQFESNGMRDYLSKLKPACLIDLIAMNALYRPGPLDSGMIDIYIRRKHGEEKVVYEHPVLEKILQDTYGVIVFQEQILQIANRMAGYSLGQADILRKAMGKKDIAIMQEQKKRFIDGSVENKVDKKVAERIFDLIETFARYGFNRAHSTCYAILAYQTAWLKIHYPHEFMAAALTSEMGDSNRVVILMDECRRMGIEVLPPDVNESHGTFTVVEDKIRFGLLAIKNVGAGPVEQILKARESGEKFESMADFVSRVDLHSLNRRALESMISAGAFDAIHANRAAMTTVLEAMITYGQTVQETSHTVDMFGGGLEDGTRKAPDMPKEEEWPVSERLSKEKEMLGFYVSGHPLGRFKKELLRFSGKSTRDIDSNDDGREISIGGIVQAIQIKVDKRGNQMAFVTLEDFAGSMELIVFSDCYDTSKSFLIVDSIILAWGRVSTREGQAAKLIVSRLIPLSNLADHFNCCLVLDVEREDLNKVGSVWPTLEPFRGDRDIIIITRKNGEELTIKPRNFQVRINGEVVDKLKDLLGEDKAYLVPAQN